MTTLTGQTIHDHLSSWTEEKNKKWYLGLHLFPIIGFTKASGQDTNQNPLFWDNSPSGAFHIFLLLLILRQWTGKPVTQGAFGDIWLSDTLGSRVKLTRTRRFSITLRETQISVHKRTVHRAREMVQLLSAYCFSRHPHQVVHKCSEHPNVSHLCGHLPKCVCVFVWKILVCNFVEIEMD